MAKEKKQDSGWQFPKALEIVKCKEGNKEFMKERPARRPFGNTVLICEYPLDGDAMQEPNARMITWRLAKRAARDFLRVSFMTSAIVTAARTDTTYFHDYIYGKAEIRFVRGRLRFTDDEGNASDPAPFPSMVVIYNGERVKQ